MRTQSRAVVLDRGSYARALGFGAGKGRDVASVWIFASFRRLSRATACPSLSCASTCAARRRLRPGTSYPRHRRRIPLFASFRSSNKGRDSPLRIQEKEFAFGSEFLSWLSVEYLTCGASSPLRKQGNQFPKLKRKPDTTCIWAQIASSQHLL